MNNRLKETQAGMLYSGSAPLKISKPKVLRTTLHRIHINSNMGNNTTKPVYA